MSEEREEYEVESAEAQVPIEELPEATFDDILAEYEQEEEEFDFVLGEGLKAKRYRGKTLSNLSDHLKMGEDALKFQEQYERIRKTPMKDIPEAFRAWKQYARRPMQLKAAIMILAINRLLITPKLTQLQCLRMHDKGGQALMDIGAKLLGRSTEDAYTKESEAVQDAKNA